jgi:hypothetical protein
VTWLLAGLFVLGGCAMDRGPTLDARSAGSPAARHAVTGTDLRATMAELDRFRPERMPQELSGVASEREHLRVIAETARRMAGAADAIPLALENVRLQADDRQRFLELAAALRAEALAIMRAAERGDAPDVRRRVTAIGTTCNECHSEFRILRAAGG